MPFDSHFSKIFQAIYQKKFICKFSISFAQIVCWCCIDRINGHQQEIKATLAKTHCDTKPKFKITHFEVSNYRQFNLCTIFYTNLSPYDKIWPLSKGLLCQRLADSHEYFLFDMGSIAFAIVFIKIEFKS